jgi:hypothetical protein
MDVTIRLLLHMWQIVGALVCAVATVGFGLTVLGQIGLINFVSEWEAMPATLIIAAGGYLSWRLGKAGLSWHARLGKMF